MTVLPAEPAGSVMVNAELETQTNWSPEAAVNAPVLINQVLYALAGTETVAQSSTPDPLVCKY